MRFKNLDLNLLVALNYFLTEKNVSRAAEKMFISQSAASNALSRLRNFLNDDILIQVGKKMELTPRAKELIEPVRNILVSIDSQIIHQHDYNPCEQEVVFKICVSDYTLVTFVPKILQHVQEEGYLIEFDFLPQSSDPIRTLEQGEADLLIIPRTYASDKHPYQELYEENFVCIASQNHGRIQHKLDLHNFLEEKHIVMQPPNFSESYETLIMKKMHIERQIAMTSYSFSAIPELVAQTEYLATLHQRLAEKYANLLQIQIFPLPFDFPTMPQVIQWHRLRNHDSRLIFFNQMLKEVCLSFEKSSII